MRPLTEETSFRYRIAIHAQDIAREKKPLRETSQLKIRNNPRIIHRDENHEKREIPSS